MSLTYNEYPRIRMDMQDRPEAMPMGGMFRHAIEVGRTRLFITAAVMGLAFATVGARLVDLSIHSTESAQGGSALAAAEAQNAGRANIRDRNGVILATNLSTASLFANPRRILDPVEAADSLLGVLPDLDRQELIERLSRDRAFVWLKRNLTPRQVYAVNALGIPGLDFRDEQTRVYPQGELMAHVLGFVDVDNRGLSGIEKGADDLLHEESPLDLTLDMRVQHAVRDELMQAMKEFSALGAAGIVMDARNGEILALASLPDFDPNRPGQADADTRFNRATLGQYELGSTFKIFNTAMALEAGVTSMFGGYDATNPIQVARFTIRDYHAKRRWLSVPEIFMYSSNIGSAKMALDVGGEGQRAFLKQLGLLDPIDLRIPETGSPMAPAIWRPINTMTIAFGHGIAVSPLHLTAAVSTVVNGGIYHAPTLLSAAEAARPESRRVMSDRTSHQMRQLLRLVVDKGTGKNAAAEGYFVGGKTGTAEKQLNGRYKRNALISSFVAAFPMNDPKYVVFAMLDEPNGTKETHGYATGGWVAAPSVRRIIERIGPMLGVAPVDETATDLQQVFHVPLMPEGGPRLASF